MLVPGLSAEVRLKEGSQMSCTDKGGQGPFRGQDAPFARGEYSARDHRLHVGGGSISIRDGFASSSSLKFLVLCWFA